MLVKYVSGLRAWWSQNLVMSSGVHTSCRASGSVMITHTRHCERFGFEGDPVQVVDLVARAGPLRPRREVTCPLDVLQRPCHETEVVVQGASPPARQGELTAKAAHDPVPGTEDR